jgi:hypothetical protein
MFTLVPATGSESMGKFLPSISVLSLIVIPLFLALSANA